MLEQKGFQMQKRMAPAGSLQQGFSLIELMISIGVGMIVVAGAMSMFGSTITNNRDMLASMRLNQDLSTVMTIINSELRRAGFGPDVEWDDVENDNATINLTAGGSCVLYSYDKDNNGTIEAGERRGFRFDGDNIRMRERCDTGSGDAAVESAYCSNESSCEDPYDWQRMLDQNLIEVTAFSMNTQGSKCMHSGTNTYWIKNSSSSTKFPCRQWLADEDDDENVTIYEWDGTNDVYFTSGADLPSWYEACDADLEDDEKDSEEDYYNASIEVKQVNLSMTAEYELVDGTPFSKTLETTVKSRNEQVTVFNADDVGLDICSP